MDKNKVISRYNFTLELISKLNLKHEPVILKKGELFIDYGEQTNKIGILINGLLICDLCFREWNRMDFPIFLSA